MRSYLTFIRLKALIFSSLILLMPITSYARDNILVILSNNTSIYNDFYVNINNKINKTYNVNISYADNITEELLNKHKLIILAGTKSATSVNNYKFNTPVLYSLVPKDFYNSLITTQSCPGSSCYGVYINQPAERYIQLVNALFKNNKSIIIPVTESTRHDIYHIKSTAKDMGYKSRKMTVMPNENISRLLSHKLKDNDILLALPDPDIYNKNTARSIILTTYHNNVPIIAYSRAFTKAGALASLYSSIDDIAEQTTILIQDIFSDNKPQQKGYYPEKFSLEVNKAVAHSLNINIASPGTIKRKIK